MSMDPHTSGFNQNPDGAPYSASAYPTASAGGQPPVLAPQDIPADEPFLSRMYDILTHPTNIPHYVAHLRGAKWSTIIWLTVGLGLIESVATAIGGQMSSSGAVSIPGLSQLPLRGQAGLEAASRLGGNHGNLLTALIGLFLGSFIYWLLAKLLGGQGSYLQTAWLVALITTPINAASALLGLIPVVGLLVGIVLGVYQVIMTIFAMAAAHRLTVGRATAVVLIPLAFAIALIIFIIGASVAILAGSLGK